MKPNMWPRLVIGIAAVFWLSGAGSAQLYVGGRDPDLGTGTVATFDPISGAVINPSFITGLPSSADALALDGNGILYVKTGSRIGTYNAATGAAIDASFNTGLPVSQSMALDRNGNLLLGTLSEGVAKYNASSGALISSTFIAMPHPYGIFVDPGGQLFATTFTLGSIAKYDAATGAAISVPLIDGDLSDPWGVVVDQNRHLFVGNEASGVVGEYDADTGAVINATLFSASGAAGLALDAGGNVFVGTVHSDGDIMRYDAGTGTVITFNSGLDQPIAVAIVPEPSGFLLLGSLGVLFLSRRLRSGKPW